MDYSRTSTIFIRSFSKVVTGCLYLFVAMELVAFFTQSNLTEKQENDRLVFGCSHPLLVFYYESIDYYNSTIKLILYTLSVVLKEVYNDEEIEKRMIRKSKLYSAAYIFSFSSSLISYGFDGLMQVVNGDGTFTTVITAWPKVEDRSACANVSRVLSYLIWWLFMIRVSAVYVLIISLTICLSHQYMSLQSYFYSLQRIFEGTESTQAEKEKAYEESVKIGIQLHADTLW
ncbi:unnamed protein product, partial [Iphiclides podalirius]